VFEFRFRVLDAREREGDPPSYLGIAEGLPSILTHSESIERAEVDLTSALEQYLARLMDHCATRLELDEFPTVAVARLWLVRADG
jgi:predicted RNase H-like HicB family nuclease